MCRLFGKISKAKTDISYYFFNADKKPFKDFVSEHKDGWGIGWYSAKKPKIFKEGLDDVIVYSFNKVKKIKSKIILCHLRKASEGAKVTKNSHPFTCQNWIFEHNGFVSREHLLKHLEQKYKDLIKGKSDSEVYFLIIMQFYEKTKDIVKAIKEALKLIKQDEFKGLNFILSDGEKIYAYRDASVKTKDLYDYYSLSYLVKKKEIIFSSDPLTKENWTMTNLGELVIADENAVITKFNVNEGNQ